MTVARQGKAVHIGANRHRIETTGADPVDHDLLQHVPRHRRCMKACQIIIRDGPAGGPRQLMLSADIVASQFVGHGVVPF